MLNFEDNDKKRKIREAIEILKCGNTVNFKSDACDIKAMYSPLLGRTRHRKSHSRHVIIT